MSASNAPERVFLGWHGPLLDRAAEFILAQHGEDLAHVLVALPGARAAQSLRLALARRANPSWTPPAILTQGKLTDELVMLDRPVASRFTRTVAWKSALQSLPPERFAEITPRRPDERDFQGWLAIAELVRALHADLAEEGLVFDDVVRRAGGLLAERDRARWQAFATAQSRWEDSLARLELADPHRSRFDAIEKGSVDRARTVILVGVADMNRLLRHLIVRVSCAQSLVFAPAELAHAFDELGCLVPDAWKDRELPLASDRWHVVEGPDSQAARAVDLIAGWSARFQPSEVVIGVADEEVAPHLERRLAEHGIHALHAVGGPMTRTPLLCWLADLARYLDGRSFAACAALVRHPDIEAWLARHEDLAGVDFAASLDQIRRDNLPARAEGDLPGAAGRVIAALDAGLGDLARGERSLSAWADPIRRLIADVIPADAATDETSALVQSLDAVGRALAEFASASAAQAEAKMRACAAIECLLLALQGETLNAKAPPAGEPALELIGWLDLALDPAPALVVTGFVEGRIPRTEAASGLLPESVERELGLPSRDARLARDLYAATVLCASRREIAFVTGRRSRAGDPLLPSRLAFHVADAELVERVERYLASEAGPLREKSTASADYALPRDPNAPAVRKMHVTSFRDYIESPYGFYLKHVLELETVDDRAREMDGRVFGIFAHNVLQSFAQSTVKDSESAGQIEEFLRAEIDARGRVRFGAKPLPAVGLQLEQLARRMKMFAAWQAEWAARGWRIAYSEWKPAQRVDLDLEDGTSLEPDGASMELSGRIDRIDVNARTGEWALLDYKTGGKVKEPAKEHRTRDRWRDLQLPLYTLLARELRLTGERQLGYVCIGRDPCEVGDRLVDGWSDEVLESALATARDVARKVRAGEFFETGSRTPRDPILAAIEGRGLLASSEEDGGEEA